MGEPLCGVAIIQLVLKSSLAGHVSSRKLTMAARRSPLCDPAFLGSIGANMVWVFVLDALVIVFCPPLIHQPNDAVGPLDTTI